MATGHVARTCKNERVRQVLLILWGRKIRKEKRSDQMNTIMALLFFLLEHR